MRIFRNGALALLVAGAMAAPTESRAQAQDDTNTGIGTAAAEFLLLGAGARGMVLGPSFAAITRDVEATYYNPAGLPLMEGPQAEFTMMSYFADTDYVWAGFALPLSNGEFGMGINIGSFGFSDATVYREQDPDGEEGLLYDVRETVIGLSFAHAFIDRFTGGVTLKYISDQLGQAEASGFAVDVGTNFHTEWNGRPIALAFVIQNLGSTMRHSGTRGTRTPWIGEQRWPPSCTGRGHRHREPDSRARAIFRPFPAGRHRIRRGRSGRPYRRAGAPVAAARPGPRPRPGHPG